MRLTTNESKTVRQRIILASSSEHENYILKRKVDPLTTELGPLQVVTLRPQAIHSALDTSVSMIILNMPTFGDKTKSIIDEARRLGYAGPVLVAAKVGEPNVVDEIKEIENVVLLEKPYEVKDLQGIARKFILARKVAQRVHRRFTTAQPAEVAINDRRLRSVTTLFNLSRGGAYFEFPVVIDLKSGDLVEMKIDLNEMNRVYEVPARVVWTTARGFSGGKGVGVEFTGPVNGSGTSPEEPSNR